MAVSAKDLRVWLATLDDNARVFVDEGGLTLRAQIPGTGASFIGPYFEVGRAPHDNPAIIDWTPYGMFAAFESVEVAQAAVRDCGEEFKNVSLTRRGDDIVNERGDVVGYWAE